MKDKDSSVFTADQKPNQMLCRETITMGLNKVMHPVSELLPSKFLVNQEKIKPIKNL